VTYAKSLVAATPEDALLKKPEAKAVKGLTPEQIALMEKEATKLQTEFKRIEITGPIT
jgi:hypothetical protein